MRNASKDRFFWQMLAAGFALAAIAGRPSMAVAAERAVYEFPGTPNGAFPVGLMSSGGTMYGATYAGGAAGVGTIFSILPSGEETVLYSFVDAGTGTSPAGVPLNVKGTLYGTTAGGGTHGEGTVYRLLPDGTEQVIHSFGAPNSTDGAVPYGALIEVSGKLYGVTTMGGTYNSGTVFSIAPDGSSETVLHSFGGIEDGEYPSHGLLDVGGILYGTTPYGGYYSGGGENFGGTVYSVSLSGHETVLHSFGFSGTPADGSWPECSLIDVNGVLYGTTQAGGAYGEEMSGGTVFSITPTGHEKLLHSFNTSGPPTGFDGTPTGSLTAVGDTLYGITGSATYSNGGVFSLTRGGTETLIYNFSSPNNTGYNPTGGLVRLGGSLYGTTLYGTPAQSGAVFAISP